jgi:hypothetical protein
MQYINILRKTVTALYLISIFIATTRGGLIWGLAIGVGGLIAYIPFRDYIRSWEHREALKLYARMLENIVVISEYEDDKEVVQRAREELLLLEESQNKEFIKGNLKVHCFFFKVNEWVESILDLKYDTPQIKGHFIQCKSYDRFLEIVEEWKERDRVKQYEAIAKEDSVWFINHALEQQ